MLVVFPPPCSISGLWTETMLYHRHHVNPCLFAACYPMRSIVA